MRRDKPFPKIWYHLTDRARFRLDPKFTPADLSTRADRKGRPGIYLAPSVVTWVEGHSYWRPFVAEFEVHPLVLTDRGIHGRYGGEMFVPASAFCWLELRRVIPLDAHAREEFGCAGWFEKELGVEFDTGRPIKPRLAYRGYRYPGPDVRRMPVSEVKRLKRQMRRALG